MNNKKTSADSVKISAGDFNEKIRKYEIFRQEANHVREKDKKLIRELFKSFSHRDLRIGIGFQRAYGSILSGDYFDLFKLSDNNFLFIFADISGHGLPAYTTLIRLRSAIIIAVKEMEEFIKDTGRADYPALIRNIALKFTDIMDMSNSNDFAAVNFVFVEDNIGSLKLSFFNRSMLYPIILRRNGARVESLDLNTSFDGWKPEKGYLLGSDIKNLIPESTYFHTPECTFDIFQGDMIFFFTDGIIEAFDYETKKMQFGEERLKQKLVELADFPPQLLINNIFDSVYEFIGKHEHQKDDMSAVIIDLPPVSDIKK